MGRRACRPGCSRMAEAALSAPIVRPKVSRDDWTMRAFIGVIGLYLVVTLALPLYTMMSKSVRDHDGVFVGLANYIDYFATPALTWSIGNSLQVATITTLITVTVGFTFAYALTRSCIPLKGLFQSITMIPIPGAVAAARHRAGLPLRHPGADQGAAVRALHLRPDRHRDRGGVLHPAARHHHPDHLAVHRRRPPVRSGGGAAREPNEDLLHRHSARLPVRPHQRRVRGVHPRDHGFRGAQGHRRGLQRAGHRRLQAGDRAAELRDGGGGERRAPHSGRARIRRRPRGAAPAGRPALLARGGAGAEAEPHLRRRDARLLRAGERVPDRHAWRVPVRGARQVLPLRPELRPAELRLRT